MRNIMGRRTKLAAAVLAVFAVAGCASLGALGGFREPIVSFKDLRVRGLGLTGGSLDVGLSAHAVMKSVPAMSRPTRHEV